MEEEVEITGMMMITIEILQSEIEIEETNLTNLIEIITEMDTITK